VNERDLPLAYRANRREVHIWRWIMVALTLFWASIYAWLWYLS
jgi:hypothetical protein